MSDSRLYYHGTNVEVRLGDRVLLKTFLGKKRPGFVSYIPGQSNVHTEMEGPGFSQWAITLDSGENIVWAYVPEELQPHRQIVFVSRGELAGDLLPLPEEF